jgi:threonine dehydrogenase-like Zn-dependent dehydrogenase
MVFCSRFSGCHQANVKAGSLVYVAGAGPVGLCAAVSAFLRGAAAVFISDRLPDRLKLAEGIGCKCIDLSKTPAGTNEGDYVYSEIEKMLPPEKNCGHKLVDASVECVRQER